MAAVLMTACGDETSAPASSTPPPAAGGTAAPEPSSEESAPSESESEPGPTESGPSSGPAESGTGDSAPAGEGASDTIEIPSETGLPVKTLPLMPGAVVETKPNLAGPGTVSFTIELEGSSSSEIGEWYAEAMTKEGFDVEARDSGAFSYRGRGVEGDSGGTSTAFILGMREA